MNRSKSHPLKRKYAAHRLDEVHDMIRNRQINIMANVGEDRVPFTPSEKLQKQLTVHLVRPYDLRYPLEVKALDVNTVTGWTAFVNNAGTLIHIVPREGDLHLRLPLYRSVKGCSDQYIEKLVYAYMHGRFR